MDGITDLMDVSLSELRDLVMDRKAWSTVIHGVAKSQTRLSDFIFTFFHLLFVQFSSVTQSCPTLETP